MGDFLSGALGTKSGYQAAPQQAGNAYSQQVLQDQLNKQAQIYGGQQNLAQLLQAQAAGQGPNPAQTMYQQNVNQNIANTQGMLSGQRGLNPALAAKLGANAGAQANQQAAAQSGLMQQEQQLGATANLGNLYGQMEQGNLGQQQLFNQSNLGAMQTNAQIAGQNQQASKGIVGGVLGGVGSLLGLGKAHGGMIEGYAAGGNVGISGTPMSNVGKFLTGFAAPMGQQPGTTEQDPLMSGISGFIGGAGKFLKGSPKGPKQMPAVGGMSEPTSDDGGRLMSAKGGKVPHNFKPGGQVPGRAAVKGDSLKNDTVPAMLSPGEIVVPKSVTETGDPDKARDFVAAILARENMRKKK